MKELPANLDP